MTGAISEQFILEGSWHALAQAGRLLNSAVGLFQAGDPSTALAIAMFGREELGRSRLLRDFAREVGGGRTLTSHDVRKRCEKHVAKQDASAFSVVLKDRSLRTLLPALSESDPSSKEWQNANALLEKATKAKQKRQPNERHESRCSALYVDLNDTGTCWRRPIGITEEQARDGIQEALK